MKTLYMLKGINGTGKGTRMSTLMEWLKTQSPHEIIDMGDVLGTDKKREPVGVRFPELKVVFIGKWVQSNKEGRLISWTSLDGFSNKKESWPQLMRHVVDNLVFAEGYFANRINKQTWSPKTVASYGYKNFFMEHFLYNSIEELQQRCVERSGEEIKGAGWGENVRFMPANKQITTTTLFGGDCCNAGLEDWDYRFTDAGELVWMWGMKMVEKFLLQLDVIAFSHWAQDNDTRRSVKESQYNRERFSKYLKDGKEDKRENKLW